jgi:hypothetical protein
VKLIGETAPHLIRVTTKSYSENPGQSAAWTRWYAWRRKPKPPDSTAKRSDLSGRTKHASQSAGSMTENALGHRPTRSPLVQEGTPEFEARCQDAMDKVCQKYAWTAQQDGIVLRRKRTQHGKPHGAVSDDHRTPARTGRPPWGGGEVRSTAEAG